jgi:hypothetical protein
MLTVSRGGHSIRKAAARWSVLKPLIEEILLSEILTRVWTGHLAAHDRITGSQEAEAVAKSVLAGQLEVRQRALSLLLHATGVPIADAVAINALRRKADRWTDLLLGYLPCQCDLTPFAADPQRMKDFALDWRDCAEEPRTAHWSLLLASLSDAFPTNAAWRSPNADLNERIAASIIACFPDDAFDCVGLFHSLWMLRLRYAADNLSETLDVRA